MTDYPTVGLAVDLSGIDAGDKAYADLQKRIEGVGDAAEVAGKKVTTSLRGQTAARGEAAQAAGDQAAAEARVGTTISKADAAVTKQQEANRRYLQQVRINSIQMEEAARRAAQAIELQEAGRQAAALIAADRAATAEAERNRKYLLQVRLNSFKMEETAGQKAAMAQIAMEQQIAAAAARRAEAQAAAAALAQKPVIVAGAPSSTAQMAEQITAQETAYLAQAKAAATATAAQAAFSVETQVAADAAASQVTGLEKVVAAYAAAMKVTDAEARAVLNTTAAYKGMFPPLSAVVVATEDYADRADKLRAALIPGAAAQQLFASRTADLNALLQAGAVTQAEYTVMMGVATKEAAAASTVIGGTSIKIRESIVLLREFLRGDFSRMAGSASILFNAFVAITAELVSMIAVIAAAAAPFAILGFAALKGEEEISKFNGALISTGHYAGLTATQMEDLAATIARSSDTTIGSSKKTVEALAETGKFSASTIASLADAAQNYSRITHESADKYIKEYEGMKDHLVQFAVKHEDVYHDLTLQQVQQIDWLVKHGQEAEAQERLAADIDAASKKRRAEATAEQVEQFGTIQRAMHELMIIGSNMWDILMGVGRPATPTEKLGQAMDKMARDSMQAQIARKTPLGNTSAAKAIQDAAMAQDLAAVDAAQKALNAENTKAAAAAAEAKKNHDAIQAAFGDGKAKGRTRQDPVQNRLDALKAEVQSNRDLAAAYDVSTAAGFKAQAMKQAEADAAKLHTDAIRFETLELQKNITATTAASAKTVDQLKAEAQAQDDATKIVLASGIDRAKANEIAKQELAVRNQLTAATVAGQLAADDPSNKQKAQDAADALYILQQMKGAQDALNAAKLRAFEADETVNQKKVNEDLQVELDTVNMTNRARAVYLASLKAEQDLRAHGASSADLNSRGAQTVIFNAVANANTQQDVASGVGDLIKQQQFYNTMLDQMTARTKTAAADMAASFGAIGKAVADLTVVMADYSNSQAKLSLKRAEDLKAANGDTTKQKAIELDYLDATREAQLKYYGDLAGAGAEFFGKNTAAYKVLHAVQEAYYLMEFAMSAKSVLVKGAELAAKLPMYASQAAAAAAAGAAEMFAALGPAGFAAVAAMALVLAGMGVAALGGGGKTAPSQAAPRQAAQGSGSVLGDATAKSDSIAKSLEIVASNTNKDLEFSNGMLTALKSIDANISSLVAAIARELQVGGALDTSGLGLGSSSSGPGLLTRIFSPIANLLPGLFGSKTTTSLQDQGLSFGPQSVGSIVSGGIQGSTYADLAAETKKQFLGITYFDKTKNSTVTAGLDSQLQGDLTRVVASLRDGVLSAATVLGVDGAKATLDALVLNLGTVSLKDLKGADLTAAISAIFSKAGDDMAAAVLPMVSEFQKAGEGAMETLVRLARDYQVLDVSLSSIGKTFGAVGVSSLAARERLIDLAGGIDTLNSQVSDYASKFLTDGERMAPVITAVYTALGKLGDGSITTKAQFKQLVDSLDLTTASGAQTFATLMQIAPAFSDVVDYLDGLKTASQDVTTAQGKLNDAYNTAAGLIQDTRDKFQGFVDAFKAFKQQLNTGPLATLSPQDQYLRSQELYRSTQAAAAGGDPQAMSNLQSVSEAYLQASKDYYASTEPYFKDLAEVKAGIDAAQAVAQHQVDAAQQQLDALDKMVSGLITLNTSVLSVADAIQAVQAAIGSLAAAQAAQAAAQASAAAAAQAAAQAAATPPPASSGGTPPSTPPPANDNASGGGVDYNQLLAARPDVMAEYNRLIATADRNSPWFSQHGLDQGPAGFAQWWYTQGGGSASYPAHALAAATSLDSAAPLDTAAPAAPTATIASAPAAPAGGDGSAAIVAALGQLTEQVQINNVLAKAGHTGTIDKLGDLVDETIGLRTTIRAQAA